MKISTLAILAVLSACGPKKHEAAVPTPVSDPKLNYGGCRFVQDFGSLKQANLCVDSLDDPDVVVSEEYCNNHSGMFYKDFCPRTFVARCGPANGHILMIELYDKDKVQAFLDECKAQGRKAQVPGTK